MKKVLAQLFLISFLAVLLVPVMASAAECPDCQNFTLQCTCGANVLPPTIKEDGTKGVGTQYCLHTTVGGVVYGNVKSSLNGCLADAGSNTTGGTTQTGYQEIPTNVPSTPGELIGLIDKIGNWIFSALLGIAAIFLVVAGFFFITAGGDPAKVVIARQMLVNALIGVAVGLAAKGLVAIIRGFILK